MRLPHLTPEQFRANSDWVHGLRDFLQSDTGAAVLSVIQGMHPLRKLADTRIAADGTNIRAAAAGESEAGRSENLLGRLEGYETAIEILTQQLTTPHVAVPPQSRKAGGRDIKPAPTPRT
jgi:hypothetical protein